ncbi:MAG: cyclic nucleotide-binding domain-containing protein [Geothrix sp.]|uniref:Cyclic nucleotide-binding domain-containing protein n=1 Tax=Candidatus Geothrix odensensis TaxID=2954440 RepID=A0A936F4U0_9BACT|nr:cyclic nucleotide-binding domain-containing protein [Candidatus Geothrix odensensis]MCC6513649.1 cyclic nucleotide-binding domain-containing protein [Geothrix sp.]
MIDAAFLTQSPLFRNLDETERAQILIIGQRRTCKAGEILFREGDAGDGLYVVVRGSVRISKQGATGEEALAVLESPAFFGEMALIDLSARAADAIVNEDSELFFIPLQDLRSLIEVQHRIALKILFALCEVLAQRLRETNERYMNIFTIAQWGGANPDGPIPVP